MVLIASVPGLCLLFAFTILNKSWGQCVMSYIGDSQIHHISHMCDQVK